MKEFDLEQALAGAPVITRDGTPVTELHLFQTCNDHYPLTCVVKGQRLSFTREGKIRIIGEQSEHDLFMATIKTPLWVNRYPYGAHNYKRNSKDPIAFGYYFDTKKAADDYDQTIEGRYNSAERLGGKAFLEEIEE